MFLKLFALCVVAVIIVQVAGQDDWNSYKQRFNKQYNSPQEDALHRNIYEQNLRTINEHNRRYQAGQTTYEMGVNQFTDMTEEERKRYLGLRGSG